MHFDTQYTDEVKVSWYFEQVGYFEWKRVLVNNIYSLA